MKDLKEIQRILQKQKPYLAERFGVTIIGAFGSYVRGEQLDDSDIDLLIELEETRHVDLLDLVCMERYLSDLLGIEVDIAIKSSLRKRIGKRILDEVIPI